MGEVIRWIFVVGCGVLLFVCMLGAVGVIELPVRYYAYFWAGFFVFILIVWTMIRLYIFDAIRNLFK